MTATSTTKSPVLQPFYGFPGSKELASVPAHHTDRYDVGSLLFMNESRPEWLTLRDPQAAKPTGAYGVVKLIGGVHDYYGGTDHKNNHLPWQRRLTMDPRQSYVVWGRQCGAEQTPKFYDPAHPARTSSGRGAIYSRWPIFDQQGQLTDYASRLTMVEFAFRENRQPTNRFGDRLFVKVHHSRGMTPADGMPEAPSLYGLDEFQAELATRAFRGFDKHCRPGLTAATEAWRVWFLNQLAEGRSDQSSYGGFHDRVKHLDPEAALDAVKEAWQLAAALAAHSGAYPQVNPAYRTGITTDEYAQRDLSDMVSIGYDGTSGSCERRMLEAYYLLHPERRMTFESMMSDYAALLSSIRNYTGD